MHNIVGVPQALAALLLLLPFVAQAHTGEDVHGLFSGLLHPVIGLDHLIAMCASGCWAVLEQPGRWWRGALVFCAAMLVGALSGIFGLLFAGVEIFVALSLAGLGACLALRLPLGFWGLTVVGLFAFFHGQAHVVDVAGSQLASGYLVGMIATTVALHALGARAGTLMHYWQIRGLTGLAMALAGGLFLVA